MGTAIYIVGLILKSIFNNRHHYNHHYHRNHYLSYSLFSKNFLSRLILYVTFLPVQRKNVFTGSLIMDILGSEVSNEFNEFS